MPKAAEGENDAALNAALDVKTAFGVSGKVVLITGGGSGIGAMMASGFVQNGCRVYIASRKDSSAYAAELTKKGPGSCTAKTCDISVPEQQSALIDDIKAKEGKLHVLINNSGTNYSAPLDQYSQQNFRKVMELNVDAVFALTRLAVPLLEASSSSEDPGRVINISSINGVQVPALDTFAYSTSKAAVLMLSKHLAARLGQRHITVNSICPGPFVSRMMRGTIQAAGEDFVAQGTTLGRLGSPEDMAGAALFLCSRAGAFLTGTDFAVDGGALLKSAL
jgi:NAD(P)-dependent dehydrogenase (short-subunit alcohol dehydrogenase family)